MEITVEVTSVPDVLLVRPQVFGDERGFFLEVFREDVHAGSSLPIDYVQLNHSGSVRNVLRGLHFQWDPPMGKLQRVLQGEAFLVAVDIRKNSPTLGKWFGRSITAESREMVYAPAGFARGFYALSEWVEIEYLCTGTYNGAAESEIAWNDPQVGIEWPVSDPILSDRDANAQTLATWLERPESDHLLFGRGEKT